MLRLPLSLPLAPFPVLLQLLPQCDIHAMWRSNECSGAAQLKQQQLLQVLAFSISVCLYFFPSHSLSLYFSFSSSFAVCVLCSIDNNHPPLLPVIPLNAHLSFIIKAHLIRYSVEQLVAVAQHCQELGLQSSDARRAFHEQFDFWSFSGKCSRRCAGRGCGRWLGVHHVALCWWWGCAQFSSSSSSALYQFPSFFSMLYLLLFPLCCLCCFCLFIALI